MSHSVPRQRRECWASSLGDCGTLSREHVLSQSIFRSGHGGLRTNGLNRVPDGTPVEALVAKVLCARHNSQLSPLDQEAGRLADFLVGFERQRKIELSGLLIERWALKTLVSCLNAGWLDNMKWKPASNVVDNVFGRSPMDSLVGLYMIDGDSETFPSHQSFNISPVFQSFPGLPVNLSCYGAEISLHGLKLFISLTAEVGESLTGSKSEDNRVWEGNGVRLIYQPAYISVNRGTTLDREMLLNW